jgi:hypothetical protein
MQKNRLQKNAYLLGEGRSVTPPVDSANLRHGPWTEAEANYAAAIIEGFDECKLSDCSNRTTLRTYLASKLNCSTMRVSKKLRGVKMGKVLKDEWCNAV